MNIVNKLTIRHLIKNKKRTLVTMFGTIVSAAMISGVATLGVSFTDLQKKEEIAYSGDWHVSYSDLTLEQAITVEEHENTEALSLIHENGYALIPDPIEDYKPYLYIQEMNDEAFEHFNVNVIEGRLPQNNSEIILSDSSSKAVKWQVGDEITLDIGTRFSDLEGILALDQYNLDSEGNLNETLIDQEEQTFTVVGILEQPRWENEWNVAYMAFSYVQDVVDSKLDAYVSLKNANSDLYGEAQVLADEMGISREDIEFNNGLLRFTGITANEGMERTWNGLLAVIMVVIVVGSVALIFNAFAISVSERSRHLGMLSSVGATKRQKRNSVYFEGFLIGVISVPIGIIAGIAGIGITFIGINPMLSSIGYEESLQATVTPFSIISALIISSITIFISTWIPALRASRITAMDAIRQTHDVKLKSKNVRTLKYVRNWFGLEAELGLKNLKRNKKRYNVTVLSLIVSIVLFLSVSSFTNSLERSYSVADDGVNYDLDVSLYGDDLELKQQLAQDIQTLSGVDEYSIRKEAQLFVHVDEDHIPQQLLEPGYLIQDEQGRYFYEVYLRGLDAKSLKDYAFKSNISEEVLNQPYAAVIINEITYEDAALGKYVETNTINTEVGDTLQLYEMYYENDDGDLYELSSLEVTGLTAEIPIGSFYPRLDSVDMIVSEQTFDQVLEGSEYDYNHMSVYIQSDNPSATYADLIELEYADQLSINNLNDYRQRGENIVAILSIFSYGFITLITLISIANILNTISTSVALRKREFAMLRSVGMTSKSFRKMMIFESAIYGVKSLAYGLPISIGVMYLIYLQTQYAFSYRFTMPWLHILAVIVAVFAIVGVSMLYSLSKTKKETIIQGITQENN
ncbi:ABC transporter permease [Alkalicoccobacillus porphyridii]|uniref:FtsX-like permease family protein n=1 Tax=Alkalicoccobacillus porphyridii TaxID=2597270 RepID=A0A554A0Q8_9BACI|nr:FtsX-like permease family protein [Alkalicoccobacillus porphyridii]TSB47277.1 FtsX-like permease family protein [Alkalicoccobacillus porphyridii]